MDENNIYFLYIMFNIIDNIFNKDQNKNKDDIKKENIIKRINKIY